MAGSVPSFTVLTRSHVLDGAGPVSVRHCFSRAPSAVSAPGSTRNALCWRNALKMYRCHRHGPSPAEGCSTRGIPECPFPSDTTLLSTSPCAENCNADSTCLQAEQTPTHCPPSGTCRSHTERAVAGSRHPASWRSHPVGSGTPSLKQKTTWVTQRPRRGPAPGGEALGEGAAWEQTHK